MNVDSDRIEEVAIDYITTTARTKETETSLAPFGRLLVAEECERGEEGRQWKFSGYRGATAGQAAYGRRADSQIVRLSGGLAAMYWQQAVSLSTNVSRIDLQVTVSPTLGPAKALQRHHRQLRRANRGRGRPFGFQAFYGPRGPTGLTLGSRASDFYMRIYDKGVESRDAHYEGCLRYELELKRKPALHRAELLDADEGWQYQLARVVHEFAKVRNITPCWNPGLLECAGVSTLQRWQGPPYIAGSLSKRITYAGINNKRLVQSCVDTGRLDEYLEATGLSDHVVQRVYVGQAHMVQYSQEVN